MVDSSWVVPDGTTKGIRIAKYVRWLAVSLVRLMVD